MNNDSCIKQKKQQFHVSIRRKQLNNIFKEKRLQLKIQLVNKHHDKLKYSLDTYQKRRDWIISKAEIFISQPNLQWTHHIEELNSSLLFFQGKFELFLQFGVLKALIQVFRNQYYDADIWKAIVQLLGNMMYLEQSECIVAIQVFKHQIINTIVLNLVENNLLNEEKVFYMIFIANLICIEKKTVLDAGAMQIFVQWSKQLRTQTKIIKRADLELLYKFFLAVVEKDSGVSNSINQNLTILSVLNDYIQLDQVQSLIQLLIEILNNIVINRKQYIYITIFNHSQLIKKIFLLSTHTKESIRKSIWKILAFLSSSDKQNTDIFQENNFYQLALRAYSLEVLNHNNFEFITCNILAIIGNLAIKNDISKQNIMTNKLLDIVLDSIHLQHSQNLNRQAFSCLINIMHTENYELHNKLIYDSPTLDKLIFGLETMPADVVQDILCLIAFLIEINTYVFTDQSNRIKCNLEAKFNFQQLLDVLGQKFPSSAKILSMVDHILDLWRTT